VVITVARVLILGGVDSEPRDDAGRLAAAADEVEAGRWKLDVRPRAQRQLTRLPEKIAAAAAEFITGPLLDNRGRVGHPCHSAPELICVARAGLRQRSHMSI